MAPKATRKPTGDTADELAVAVMKVVPKSPKGAAKGAKGTSRSAKAATKAKEAEKNGDGPRKARAAGEAKPPRSRGVRKPAAPIVEVGSEDSLDEALAVVAEVMTASLELTAPEVNERELEPIEVPRQTLEIHLTDEQVEEIARRHFDQAVKDDTFDDLKRRASFDRQDAGRLRHWMAAARKIGTREQVTAA